MSPRSGLRIFLDGFVGGVQEKMASDAGSEVIYFLDDDLVGVGLDLAWSFRCAGLQVCDHLIHFCPSAP